MKWIFNSVDKGVNTLLLITSSLIFFLILCSSVRAVLYRFGCVFKNQINARVLQLKCGRVMATGPVEL